MRHIDFDVDNLFGPACIVLGSSVDTAKVHSFIESEGLLEAELVIDEHLEDFVVPRVNLPHLHLDQKREVRREIGEALPKVGLPAQLTISSEQLDS